MKPRKEAGSKKRKMKDWNGEVLGDQDLALDRCAATGTSVTLAESTASPSAKAPPMVTYLIESSSH
jgi:hypothetical protein